MDEDAVVITLVDGDLAETIDQVEKALLKKRAPVFVHGGVLVHPVTDEHKLVGSGLSMYSTRLCQLKASGLAVLLNENGIYFDRYDGRIKANRLIDPPLPLIQAMMHRNEWNLPQVTNAINVPSMRSDGSIINAPGYDANTQLWFEPDENVKLPPINPTPNKGDAIRALKLFEDLIGEFPFESPLDSSVALAGFLTAILRAAFDVSPMIFIMAHAAGSGKSYLVNLIVSTVRGRGCPVMTFSDNAEEMDKRLGGIVLDGLPFVSLDNLSSDISGDLLCQMTEQMNVTVRRLGASSPIECAWRGMVFATGNNIALRGDMSRRGIRCHLNANMEQPEFRDFENNPLRIVQENRGKYIAAAFTIALAYLAAGRPAKDKVRSIASYGAWSQWICEPLVWLGHENPAASIEQARSDDPERIGRAQLLAMWLEHVPSALTQDYTTTNIIEIASHTSIDIKQYETRTEFTKQEFHDLLVQLTGRGKALIDTARLGMYISKMNGVVVSTDKGDLSIRKNKSANSKRGVTWQLTRHTGAAGEQAELPV